MKFVAGNDRNQIPLFISSLEEAIPEEHEVRLIDAFVNTLNFAQMGFKFDFIENGRPAYHPADLLKIYIYGYLNRIRSSRVLEKECGRNIEMWLTKGLRPDHNTISNFRRDNPKAIRRVFRATVQLAQNFELIGGQLLAGDSTKLRAQNSKKNNFNPKKIEKHIAYIDAKLEEYNAILATGDKDGTDAQNRITIVAQVEKHLLQKQKYQAFEKQLEQTGDTQISTSDPQSRQMITRNNITEVAYNIQATVDLRAGRQVPNIISPLIIRLLMKMSGRLIERSEFADLIFENKQRMDKNKEVYRRRQAIVEHPFGIIKRQWDFYYIMTKKSIKRASADVGLIFTAFNLRRILNLVDKSLLKAYLKGLALYYMVITAHFKLKEICCSVAQEPGKGYFPEYSSLQ